MKVREATPLDLPEILEHTRSFWACTEFDEEWDADSVLFYIGVAMQAQLLGVLENNHGIVVGFVAGAASPLMGNNKVQAGTELAWWVEPAYRKGTNGIRLMKWIENRAKELGIKYWSMIALESESPDRAAKIYKRLGYHRMEVVYLKRIN